MKTIIGSREDALFNSGDLESLDLKVYEEFKPKAIVRDFCDIKTDDPPYAEYVSYDFYNLVGTVNTAIYNWGAGGAIPVVDAKTTRKTNKVVSLVKGFTLNPQELRAARGLGKNLDTVKGAVVAYHIARAENELFFLGDTNTGHLGIFNFDATREVASLAGSWDSAAGSVIISDLRKSVATITNTDGVDPSKLALVCNSGDRENLNKFVADANPVRTVKEALEAFGWFPAGIYFSETVTGGKAAVLSTQPEHIQLSVPLNIARMDQIIVQPNGAIQVNYEERCAGAIIRYASSVAILTGL